MSQPQTSAVTATHVVEVKFLGAVGPVLLRHLGSLAERYTMPMEVISPSSSAAPTTRARITVARAASQREAEATIASMVEWVTRAMEREWKWKGGVEIEQLGGSPIEKHRFVYLDTADRGC